MQSSYQEKGCWQAGGTERWLTEGSGRWGEAGEVVSGKQAWVRQIVTGNMHQRDAASSAKS